MQRLNSTSRLPLWIGLTLAALLGCGRQAAPQAKAPAGSPRTAAATTLPHAATASDAPANLPSSATEPQAGPLLRRWLAEFAADRPIALVAGQERVVVVQRETQDRLRGAAFDAIGRPIWQTTAAVEPATALVATGPMLAVQAGNALWAGERGGALLGHWQADGQAQARRLPMPLAGLVGQTDGAALVVLQQPAGARMARLHGEGGSVWEVAVALPTPVTAAVGILRGDAVLLGRPAAGGRAGWWLARLAAADGKVLWQREVEQRHLPRAAELLGITTALGGVAILTAGLHPGDRNEPWTLLRIDANGVVGESTLVPRAAPEAVVAGDADWLALGQARDGGLWLECWGGRLQSRYRAPWLGIEMPLALARGGANEVWSISNVWTGGKGGDQLLLSRLRFDLGSLHSGDCKESHCTATWQTGRDCAEIPASDGSPCGPGAVCTKGQCGAAPRP